MKLSIIVPIYNVEEYLVECIESILAQSMSDYELILVDDGSKDGCPAICDRYAETDQRIKVIHQSNRGSVSARKTGLRAAQGKYIGYVDGDDVISPYMYERMCSAAEEYKCDMVMCDFVQEEKGERRIIKQKIEGGCYDKERLVSEVYPNLFSYSDTFEFGVFPALWSKICRKEILEKWVCRVDERITIGDDAACSYFALMDSDSMVYLKGEGLYFYRTRENSLCRTYDNKRAGNIAVLLDYLQRELQAFSYTGTDRIFLIYSSYMIESIIIQNHENMKDPDKKKKIYEDYRLIKNSNCGEKLYKNYRKLDIPGETKCALWYFMHANGINEKIYRFCARGIRFLKRRIVKR